MITSRDEYNSPQCMFTVPGMRVQKNTQTVMGPVDAWIARTHDLMATQGGRSGTLDPSQPAHTGWCIDLVVSHPNRVTRIRHTVRVRADMDSVGFEPTASSLQRRHSAAEL